ncbi:MAG TPA: ribosome biogenesis GTP-binding protein YihA/YsxC [Bacteroidales bacterium]|nr:ribosome biogenesis GTP-binding protein YihA/YsxC [Bacteroidales bacterium]
MKITSSEFIKSSAKIAECPKPGYPEIAFIGRSNVGKSSLINLLTARKNLAKTSVSPGKTRLINHFLINSRWYLVDLPGYGYAKVSKGERRKFGKLIENYISKRETLVNVMVLIDSRLKPQQTDLDFITWLGVNSVPFSIVFTKTDKPNQRDLSKNILNFKAEMLKTWEEMPPVFETSALKKTGREEILRYLESVIVKPLNF